MKIPYVGAYLKVQLLAKDERFMRRLNKVKAIEARYMPAVEGTALKS